MPTTGPAGRLASLQRQQRIAFDLTGKKSLATPRDAERFLEHVGLALRYQATERLPLASVRSACGPVDDKPSLVTSIELTNHLLGTACGLEVNVVANRLTIVHRSLMPALYTLVRRGRSLSDMSGLSLDARTAMALISERHEVTVGDVRRRLGPPADTRHDPGHDALSELQRLLLVDRGPFEMPKAGIPYLSADGYPYHFLHEVHADLVRESAKLSVDAAADAWLGAYLSAAVFASPRKLASLFRFLSAPEISAAIERLRGRRSVEIQKVGRETLVIWSSSEH